MNILVLTPVSIPDLGRCIPDWRVYDGEHRFIQWFDPRQTVETPIDVVVSMSVLVMDDTFRVKAEWPNALLYCYMWDCYEWVWTNPRPGEYDYKRYGELLKLARRVWVPSRCTARRVKQWWGLESEVILSSVPWFDHPNVRDDGYALCTLRHIPDPWDTKFEEACEELDIPYKRTDHRLSRAEYEDAVAGCRFLVSHYYEASTGGLSLLEGYRLGKPALINSSEWNGAMDYFENRARYFYADRSREFPYEHFKHVLRDMYLAAVPMLGNEVLSRARCARWVEANFSDRRMIDDMVRSIHASKLQDA